MFLVLAHQSRDGVILVPGIMDRFPVWGSHLLAGGAADARGVGPRGHEYSGSHREDPEAGDSPAQVWLRERGRARGVPSEAEVRDAYRFDPGGAVPVLDEAG